MYVSVDVTTISFDCFHLIGMTMIVQPMCQIKCLINIVCLQ